MRVLALMLALALAGPAAASLETGKAHEIGIEQTTRVVMGRGDYVPRPLDDRTPVIVRLGAVEKREDGFEYRLHLVGFEPGTYPLADYLMRPDGSAAAELADRTFEVRTILPENHDGMLTPHQPSKLPWFGGYRLALAVGGLVWIAGWVVLYRWGRGRTLVEAAPPLPAAPGFAERMRPYLERAAAGTLDTAGQAELERLLLSFWRDRLAPSTGRVAADLAALRVHPEAGATITALEQWLHQPGGADAAGIEALLAPYRGNHEPEGEAA